MATVEMAGAWIREPEPGEPEYVLKQKLAESPFTEIEGVFSPVRIDQVLSARKAYFTAYYQYWKTRDPQAEKLATWMRNQYNVARDTLASDLAAYSERRNIDPEHQAILIDNFARRERERLNEIKASLLGSERQEAWKRTKEALRKLVPGKLRALAFAFVAVGTAAAVDYATNPDREPEPTEDTARPNVGQSSAGQQQWDNEGLSTEENLRSRDNVHTLTPELVQEGEGAIHAFKRLLPRMGQANLQSLFSQLEIPLPATLDEQADVLARQLNLLNDEGESALLPYVNPQEQSSFVITIVTVDGKQKVEIVLNTPTGNPQVLLDTQNGPQPYEGPFDTK